MVIRNICHVKFDLRMSKKYTLLKRTYGFLEAKVLYNYKYPSVRMSGLGRNAICYIAN